MISSAVCFCLLTAAPINSQDKTSENFKSMARAKTEGCKMVQKQNPCALAAWRETIFQMSQETTF